jgi:hypothetical protein
VSPLSETAYLLVLATLNSISIVFHSPHGVDKLNYTNPAAAFINRGWNKPNLWGMGPRPGCRYAVEREAHLQASCEAACGRIKEYGMRLLLARVFKRYGRNYHGVGRVYWELGWFCYVESSAGPQDFCYFDLRSPLRASWD